MNAASTDVTEARMHARQPHHPASSRWPAGKALTDRNGRVSGPDRSRDDVGFPRQMLESRIRALHVTKHQFKPV
jgi:hypothetical protein